MTRKITLEIDSQLFTAQHAELTRAIGYLSFWNYPGFDSVLIYNSKHDLMASYTNSDNDSKYFIAGIFSDVDKTFSFHS